MAPSAEEKYKKDIVAKSYCSLQGHQGNGEIIQHAASAMPVGAEFIPAPLRRALWDVYGDSYTDVVAETWVLRYKNRG